MYHCNNCYDKPNEQEGCFTTDVTEFIMENVPPCLDGTWHLKEEVPEFNLVEVEIGRL